MSKERDRLIGTAEAATELGISQREVQHLCKKGYLPYQIVSGRYAIQLSDARKLKGNLPKPGPKSGK